MLFIDSGVVQVDTDDVVASAGPCGATRQWHGRGSLVVSFRPRSGAQSLFHPLDGLLEVSAVRWGPRGGEVQPVKQGDSLSRSPRARRQANVDSASGGDARQRFLDHRVHVVGPDL